MNRHVYYYNGIERLQLCFASPNICGAFLVVALFIYIGCILEFNTLYKRKIIVPLECFALIVLEVLVALTYSRGAFIATLVGLAFGFYLTRNKLYLFCLCSFFLCICFSDCGVHRIYSLAKPFSDASIYHRFDFWKGATAIMWQSPLTGRKDFMQIYNAWWLPLDYDSNAGSMVSDVFSLGARFGCLMPLLYLYLISSSVSIGMLAALKNFRNRSVLVSMSNCVFVYFVSALFSTICFSAWYLTAGILIVAFTLTFIGLKRLRYNMLSFFKSFLLIPLSLSLILTITMLLWGRHENSIHCLRMTEEWRELSANGSLLMVSMFMPRGKKSNHVVVIRRLSPSPISTIDVMFIRKVIRPLLLDGFDIMSIACKDDKPAFEYAIDYFKDRHDNKELFVALIGEMSSTVFYIRNCSLLSKCTEPIEEIYNSDVVDDCIVIPHALKQFNPRCISIY